MSASLTFASALFRARRKGELRRSCAPWTGSEEDSFDCARWNGAGAVVDRPEVESDDQPRRRSAPHSRATPNVGPSTERRRTDQSP